MAAKPALSVADFLAQSRHPRRVEAGALRDLLMAAAPGLTEGVKWNAPSFCHGGDDRITLALRPNGDLQAVFHRGAKVRAADGFAFADPGGLARWPAPDRGILTLRNAEDLAMQAGAIADLARRWIAATAQDAG